MGLTFEDLIPAPQADGPQGGDLNLRGLISNPRAPWPPSSREGSVGIGGLAPDVGTPKLSAGAGGTLADPLHLADLGAAGALDAAFGDARFPFAPASSGPSVDAPALWPLGIAQPPQDAPPYSDAQPWADGAPAAGSPPSKASDLAALLRAAGGGDPYAAIGPVSPAAQQLAAALTRSSGGGAQARKEVAYSADLPAVRNSTPLRGGGNASESHAPPDVFAQRGRSSNLPSGTPLNRDGSAEAHTAWGAPNGLQSSYPQAPDIPGPLLVPGATVYKQVDGGGQINYEIVAPSTGGVIQYVPETFFNGAKAIAESTPGARYGGVPLADHDISAAKTYLDFYDRLAKQPKEDEYTLGSGLLNILDPDGSDPFWNFLNGFAGGPDYFSINLGFGKRGSSVGPNGSIWGGGSSIEVARDGSVWVTGQGGAGLSGSRWNVGNANFAPSVSADFINDGHGSPANSQQIGNVLDGYGWSGSYVSGDGVGATGSVALRPVDSKSSAAFIDGAPNLTPVPNLRATSEGLVIGLPQSGAGLTYGRRIGTVPFRWPGAAAYKSSRPLGRRWMVPR